MTQLQQRSRGLCWAALLLTFLWLAPPAAGQSATTQASTTGVALRVGDAQIEIAPANDAGVFRLGIRFSNAPATNPSVFLAIDNALHPCQGISDGVWKGIKTAAGELRVNSDDGHWLLLDAHGKPIIASSPMAKLTQDAHGHASIVMTMAKSSDRATALFGSGDGVTTLRATRAASHVGNGLAVIPFYWSPSGYAVLVTSAQDNSPASWELSTADQSPTWTIPGTSVDFYLMPAANLYEALDQYTRLTGRPPVPPRWTFGYLQSRWGWKDRADIEDALKQFADRKLPVDAFIFDFEWYTPQPDYSLPPQGRADYHDFQWNPDLFPEPEKQIQAMHDRGVHVVGIRKPRLGSSDLLAQFRQKGWILNLAKGGIDSRCLDFQNPQVRAWYAGQIQPLLKAGVDGWWNDEGELTYTTYAYWNQAEADALAKSSPGARLWTLNRAFSPGLQRYGSAAWTGDLHGSWRTLSQTPTHLLNWSLAGMSYSSCDIGGFFNEITPELFTRWMQAGVFFPVMRAHATNSATPRFPWLFGPEAEAAIKKALQLRYRLLPTYYSLAHQSYQTGAPLMRPLTMEFPDDPTLDDLSSQWLMGSRLMAAPILDAGGERGVYLPDDSWYALDSNQRLEGHRSIDVTAALDEIPVYLRAGTILPLAPIIEHTDQLPGGPLELQIYPGKDATFTLIEDDGHTLAYQTGQIRRTTFTWNDAARKLSWKIEGPYAGKDVFTSMNIEVFDPAGKKSVARPLATSGEWSMGGN